MTMPRVPVVQPRWRALLAISLLLSAWAVYLDPVVDDGGVAGLHAARLLADGDARGGLAAADRPAWSALVALVSGLGLSTLAAARVLTALFHAVLVLGFASLAGALGGGGRTRAIAALVVLAFPALNGFRAEVGGDVAYWALYVWSLTGFVRCAGQGRRQGLGVWLGTGAAAALLDLEMLIFLLVAPAWLWARSVGGRRAWTVKLLVIGAGGALAVGYAAGQQAWQADPLAVLSQPVEALAGGWADLGQGIRFKVEGLRNHFLDQYSRNYDDVALLVTLSALSLAALLKALGPMYVLAGGAVRTALGRLPRAAVRGRWRVFAVLAVLLLLVPAVIRFTVTPSDAMPAALTMLAVLPPSLALWWRSSAAGRWWVPAILALVLVAGVAGLDLRADDQFRRNAGLWLRNHAAPGDALLSNSQAVVFYSDLDGYRRGADYSWREAMAVVWRDQWRDYDFLAMEVSGARGHREGILLRKIGIEPVKTFANRAGDRVLIFRPGM